MSSIELFRAQDARGYVIAEWRKYGGYCVVSSIDGAPERTLRYAFEETAVAAAKRKAKRLRIPAAGHQALPPASPLEVARAPGAALDPGSLPPIETHHIFPPIPIRIFDWCAYRDPEKTPYGYGRTEAEAIADLLAIEDEE